jgi:DNA replication protein DnaC
MKANDIIPLLDELGFIGMKEHLASILDIESTNISEAVCLALSKLLTIELEYKKARSLNYRLKLAKFPSVKLLEETAQAKLVLSIDINNIIKQHENILLIGGSGSAKTHLAIGLAYKAITNGYRAKFYTLSELASRLLKAKTHNYEAQFMESINRFQVVVIDELGYVPIDNNATSLLFTLFAKLYEHTSVIITTHLKFEEWGNMFGDAKSTKAIIDRITHHCKIIETGNKSFRNQEVK